MKIAMNLPDEKIMAIKEQIERLVEKNDPKKEKKRTKEIAGLTDSGMFPSALLHSSSVSNSSASHKSGGFMAAHFPQSLTPIKQSSSMRASHRVFKD
jgi:hypothetical protein